MKQEVTPDRAPPLSVITNPGSLRGDSCLPPCAVGSESGPIVSNLVLRIHRFADGHSVHTREIAGGIRKTDESFRAASFGDRLCGVRKKTDLKQRFNAEPGQEPQTSVATADGALEHGAADHGRDRAAGAGGGAVLADLQPGACPAQIISPPSRETKSFGAPK